MGSSVPFFFFFFFEVASYKCRLHITENVG